jgi:hypothetical protein
MLHRVPGPLPATIPASVYPRTAAASPVAAVSCHVWCHAPAASAADIRSFATAHEGLGTTIRAVLTPNKHAHLDHREMHTLSSTDPQQPASKQPPVPSVEDIFGDSAPLRSAEDLAQAGIFDDGEVEEFIADLYATRRSDVA